MRWVTHCVMEPPIGVEWSGLKEKPTHSWRGQTYIDKVVEEGVGIADDDRVEAAEKTEKGRERASESERGGKPAVTLWLKVKPVKRAAFSCYRCCFRN